MQKHSIHDNDNAEQLFEYIVECEMSGERVGISSFPSPDAPDEYKEQAMEFDHEFYVEMSNDDAVLLRNDDAPGGVAFLKCKLTDSGEALEMYDLDTEYGSTFLGSVTGVR